jgi:tetratricopeptide (TPR) repeat protein
MTERATAKDDGEVLAAVDKLSKKIRRNLGESLFSIRKRDKPLAQATTSSLEALRNFTAGNKYLDRGDDDLAVPFYEKAIDVDSTFAIAYAHLAVIRSNKGSIGAASALSDKAMRWRDGTSERERYYIEAEHYRMRSAYAEAVERYHLLTDLYPDSFGGHNNLAFLYQHTRQYEDALVSISEAERVRPDTWYIHHNRALAYAGLGEYEEALRYFDAAIGANPRVAWSHMSLSWVKMFMGDVEGAMEQLEFDDDVGIWTFQKSRQKTYHYLYQGREAKVMEHIRNNLTSGPGASIDWVAAYYHQILGRIHVYRHEPGYGVEEMQKAVIAYESWLGRFYLGLAYVAGGMESEALAVIDTLDAVAIRNGLFPTRAAYYRVKGELQLARGNTEEATKQFASAQRHYDTLAVREALARAFDAQGDTDQAIAEYLYIVDHQFATFFEGTPMLWPLALYRVADLYDRTGDTAGAAGYYTRFLESQKDGDPDAWRVVRSRDRLTSLARGQ